MTYTDDKLISQLDALTTVADADLVVVADVSDSNRAKYITWANVRTWIEAFTSYFNVSSDTADNITEGASNLFMTTSERSKVAGIEASADVTDATNVDAAGAVMNTDTSTAAMNFVIDEDDMVSDSATKVPTQQSVKAYVDNTVVGFSPLSTLVTASDTLQISADSEQNATGMTHTKIKEIYFTGHGTVRIKYDLKYTGYASAHAQLYINYAAVGTDNSSSSTTYATFTETSVTVYPGDRLQIYAWSTDPAGNSYVRNFRVYYTDGGYETLADGYVTDA